MRDARPTSPEKGTAGRPLVPLHFRREASLGTEVKVMGFFKDESGQGLVEYALIIAVIAIAVIVAMIFLRGQIQNIFSNIGNNLT